MEEEAEFNWEEYLEETGAEAAPHTTFRHVCMIRRSLFNPVPPWSFKHGALSKALMLPPDARRRSSSGGR